MLRVTTGYLKGVWFIAAGNSSWTCATADSGCNGERMDNPFAFCREECHSAGILCEICDAHRDLDGEPHVRQ